jgi:hypothetical protein
MPQGSKAETELFTGVSFDRLGLRLPSPEPSPVGLANAGFPLGRGRRFFLGLGEEGGGPIYPSGSRSFRNGPQRGAASPAGLQPSHSFTLSRAPRRNFFVRCLALPPARQRTLSSGTQTAFSSFNNRKIRTKNQYTSADVSVCETPRVVLPETVRARSFAAQTATQDDTARAGAGGNPILAGQPSAAALG